MVSEATFRHEHHHYFHRDPPEQERVPAWVEGIVRLLYRIENLLMTDQDTLNQIGTTVANVATTLGTVAGDLANEIAILKAQAAAGSPLDFTNIESGVNSLQSAASTLQALDAANTVATPAAPTEPTAPVDVTGEQVTSPVSTEPAAPVVTGDDGSTITAPPIDPASPAAAGTADVTWQDPSAPTA